MRGHWHSGISEAGASGLAMGGERLKNSVAHRLSPNGKRRLGERCNDRATTPLVRTPATWSITTDKGNPETTPKGRDIPLHSMCCRKICVVLTRIANPLIRCAKISTNCLTHELCPTPQLLLTFIELCPYSRALSSS